MTTTREMIVECQKLVLDFFGGDFKKTTAWFTTGNPNFGGVSPNQLFEMDRGNKVLAFVKTQLESGE